MKFPPIAKRRSTNGSANGSANQTSRFKLHIMAAAGMVAAAALAAPRAWADTMDVGPATVTLGGFSAAESVWRARAETADIGSSFSGIPFANSPQAHLSEFRMTARQSRLSVLVQGNEDAAIHLAFYGEFDFLGAGQTANSNESNSYNPRIRNLYGQVDWDNEGLELLAGQSWSLITLESHGIAPRAETPPATIDAQYSVGFVWARQPQIRITKNWDHQFWLALSLENPQTTVAAGSSAATGIAVTTGGPGGPEFDKSNNYSFNHVPDIIAKAAWDSTIGSRTPLHIEAFGIYRSFYNRVTVGAGNALGLMPGTGNANVSGGGVGGSITLNAMPQFLDLQASAMTGSGIGRYGSGQLPDVTVKPDGQLEPLQETTILLGGTVHASPSLDLYVYAGREAEKAKIFTTGSVVSGIGNPAANTSGCFVEGGICPANLQAENQISAGTWWRAYRGRFGSLRLGLQYSYTHLADFAGTGGRPATDDNMIFTSIRYYPF